MIRCGNGARELPFDDDFVDKRVKKGRVMTEVVVPLQPDCKVAFFRKARRAAFDLAIANACFCRTGDGVARVAFGGSEDAENAGKRKQGLAKE